MDQLFDQYPSDIIEFIPGFRFLYENIQNYTDAQIQQLSEGLLTSSLLSQKYAHNSEKLIEKFQDIFKIVKSWDQGNLFEALVVYFFQIVEIKEEQLNELITQIPDAMKTEFISLADQLTQKGVQEELQKGLNQKTRLATENMLHKGIEDVIICDVLDVTPEYVNTIRESMSDK